MTQRTSTWLLLAVLLGTAGCLESARRAKGTTGDVKTDTAGDTTTTGDAIADVKADVGPDTKITCATSCDDGDPCTDSWCDETTGQCVSAALPDGTPCSKTNACMMCLSGSCQEIFPEAPECSIASDCDDGDPCTLDSCACDDGPASLCGGTWCWCEHVPSTAPGCQGCTLETCDDGDPCTDDICVGDTCTHEPNAQCLAADCTLEGLTTEVPWDMDSAGVPMKLMGSVQPAWDAVCDTSLCGTCQSSVGLNANWGPVPLQPVDDDPDGWSCQFDQCGNAPTVCEPMHMGLTYIAWGTGVPGPYLFGDSDGAKVPPPDGDGVIAAPDIMLNVEGWCLAPTPAGLNGIYQGTLYHDEGWSTDVTVELEGGLQGVETIWSAKLTAQSVTGPTVQDQELTNVHVGGGKVTFEGVVPNSYGWEDTVGFDLEIEGNHLAGPFNTFTSPYFYPAGEAPDAPGAQPPPLSSGWLELERVVTP